MLIPEAQYKLLISGTTTDAEMAVILKLHQDIDKFKKEYEGQTHTPAGDSPVSQLVIKETLLDDCLQIRWEHNVFGRLLGFRKEGGFAPDRLSFDEEANGALIIDSFERNGSMLDRDMRPATTYYYHFILKTKNVNYRRYFKKHLSFLRLDFKNYNIEDPYAIYEVVRFSKQLLPLKDLAKELDERVAILRRKADIIDAERKLAEKTAPQKSPEEQRREKIEKEYRMAVIDATMNIKGLFEIIQEKEYLMDEVRRKRQSGEIKTDREMHQLLQLIKDRYDALIEEKKGR